MSAKSYLLDYLDKAKTVDLGNDVVFRQMVKDGRRLSGLSLQQTADQLHVHVDFRIVGLWEYGYCMPYLAERQTVIQFFCDQISSMLAQAS